ncbi:putative sodium:solute symporter family permease YidK [Metabacillus crassostreae]|uniref:hypothetical protein n=1 Tax=Metabacillus crassostreae TaxID=929098 RepID=UPI0019592D28|nr:hypothetical protein [Metabacillus crassostreae]MBM7602765.1 putative sodium:solute symporter family permease YidK [Metabacillus crassostreae]
MLTVSIVLMVLGVVIVIVGFSVNRKGKTSFIAGNNEMFVPKNEKKLAERIGFVIMLFGIETVLFPVIYKYIHGVEGYHFAVIAVFHIFAVFVFMLLDQMER